MLFQLQLNVNFIMHLTLSLVTVVCLEYSLCNKLDFRSSEEQNVRTMNNMTEGKIVGGKPVDIERFPSAVILFNRGGLCGSSVLNSWAILTAAHCFDHNIDVDDMAIHAGCRFLYDQNAQTYDVKHLVIHEDYNKELQFACDIAILFLAEQIKFSDKVKKALLPNSGDWMNEREKTFEVTGWGWTKFGGSLSELGLLMASLRYISLQQCRKLHNRNFTPDMFCLYGDAVRDACKGDSGGGVLWKGMTVGIVSHGNGCAKENKPSMYANLWYFKKWIESTVTNYIKEHCKDNISD